MKIRVNQQQWEAISAEQQNEIVSGLRAAGALSAQDEIVPDSNTPVSVPAAPDDAGAGASAQSACETACNAAAAAGRVFCARIPFWPAKVVCLAVVEGARHLCLSKCDE